MVASLWNVPLFVRWHNLKQTVQGGGGDRVKEIKNKLLEFVCLKNETF